MSNKITTKSYCVKRLRDCGYHVDKLDNINYSEDDNRKWTILVDPNTMSLFITCYKDDTVHIYDGGQSVNSTMRLNTDSVEVLIEFLHERGLIHKHYLYDRRNRVE